MTTPQLQACLAAAVTLALYAFYCYWEAGRADLAASFRHVAPTPLAADRPGHGGSGYRNRARWAGLGAVVLTMSCLAAAL